MLLATCVNTPIDHNVFQNLCTPVARCSASCVNWALDRAPILARGGLHDEFAQGTKDSVVEISDERWSSRVLLGLAKLLFAWITVVHASMRPTHAYLGLWYIAVKFVQRSHLWPRILDSVLQTWCRAASSNLWLSGQNALHQNPGSAPACFWIDHS